MVKNPGDSLGFALLGLPCMPTLLTPSEGMSVVPSEAASSLAISIISAHRSEGNINPRLSTIGFSVLHLCRSLRNSLKGSSHLASLDEVVSVFKEVAEVRATNDSKARIYLRFDILTSFLHYTRRASQLEIIRHFFNVKLDP